MHITIKVLAIPLVFIAGFHTPDIFKQLDESVKKQMNLARNIRPLDQYCMLSKKTCIQDSIAITLDSNKVKPMTASQIRVKWQPTNMEEIQLTLQGLEENLGIVRYKLKHVGDNYFEGQISLPICTLDTMTWVGEITDGHKTVYPALRMET